METDGDEVRSFITFNERVFGSIELVCITSNVLMTTTDIKYSLIIKLITQINTERQDKIY